MKKPSVFNGLMVCALIMAMLPVSGPLAAPAQARGTNPYLADAGNSNARVIATSRNSVAPTAAMETTALTGVAITGPTTGTVSTAYTFTATVSPITATLPITYVWEADGQSPVTHSAVSSLTDTVTFTWASGISGTQVITVTAINAGPEVVTDTAAINILPLFSEVNTALTGVDYSSVAWGDYDNDGWLDILLTGWTGSTYIAKVYHNNGNSTFTDINAGLPGVVEGSVAWGDYDNDGWLDILLTGYDTTDTDIAKVYHNNGNGTFTDIGAGLTGVESSSVAWGDYDNDGRLDILLTGPTYFMGTSIAKVYHNNGDGTFTDIGAGLTGVYWGSVAWGDYDNDGRLDILLTGSGIAKIYHNNGNGTFTDIGAGLTGVNFSSVAWGDYDNDGRLDILLTGWMSSTTCIAKVYHNNSDGTFTDIGAKLTGVYGGSGTWGDYDNDGRLDILLTGNTGTTFIAKVYRNNSDGTFTDIGAGLPGVHYSSVAWGDYDNDGRLDILLTGSTYTGTRIAKVYHNNTPAPNSLPAAPTGLRVAVSGAAVNFAWDAAADGQTPAAGLTYNLRVGTTPGGTEIAAPMADISTGFRRVPQMGNANLGLTATLNFTTSGTYYWSVQAIDTAWAGSAFAAEYSFDIIVPLTSVTISGPRIGAVNTAYTFIATASPATTPITYTWMPEPNSGQGTANAAYSWATTGAKAITVTATNAVGTVTGTHAIAIVVVYVPLDSVTLAGPTSGVVNAGYAFTATISPITATAPITYIWSPAPNSGQGTANAAYSWATAGAKTITVTAANAGDTVTGTVAINILPLFSEVSAGLTAVFASSVAWGDYDNDGRLDILLTGSPRYDAASIAKVYHNNGDGTFTDIGAGLPGVECGSVAWGDYDNDGWLDILLTGSLDGSSSTASIAKVYHNNGNGTFTDIGAGLTGVGWGSVAWGDYDNDGRLDILLTGDMTGWISISKIYHNNGDGTFTDIGAGLTGVGGGSVAWGDYNNDGWLDILLTGVTSSASIAAVYHNNGDGTFTDIGAGLTGVDASSVAWGDYDNDGRLDILLTGWPGIAKVYHNNGNGTFTDIGAGLAGGVGWSSVAWGDYDNDGWLDILLTGSNIAKVYHNNGNGTFTDIGAGLAGVGVSSVAWGDYDNDGRLDILLTGSPDSAPDVGVTAIVKVYHNNTPATNSVPTAPTGLGATVTGATVNLAWDTATDNQTPLAGLAYNLRVGTTPGGAQIAAPMADTGTGFRRVPQLGNANLGLTATLNFTTSGTYYWSVQAIDTAWAGSAFANEGTFSIVPPANVVINGPTSGVVNAGYTFTATVNPITATTPITYTWTPDPTGGQGTANATYLWATGGAKTITVTAANAVGTVTDTHTIVVVYVPLNSVTLAGSTSGVVNMGYTFTATISPITATTPITYTWTPEPTSGQGTANPTYSWATAGAKTITVTAANAVGTVTDTHTVVVYVPLDGATLSGPTSGVVNTAYTFTATISPITAMTPITYAWMPAPDSGQGTANATYSWATAGAKTITVTATNPANTVADTHSITITPVYLVYLPVVLR